MRWTWRPGRYRALKRRLAELESAIDWQTSCTSCARLLDSGYAETVRAETAERALAAHKAALLEALGMSPTRDWDDIVNAARGMRRRLYGSDPPPRMPNCVTCGKPYRCLEHQS